MAVLSNELAKSVVSIGPGWRHPEGGVAQVMHNYAEYVFGESAFKSIANSGGAGKAAKLWSAMRGFLTLACVLSTDRSIRIVHIHTASGSSFARSAVFGRMARAMGKKLIYHVHGGAFREYYNANKNKVANELSRADKVVALSPSWKSFFDGIVGSSNVVSIDNLIAPPVSALVNGEPTEHRDTEGHVVKLLFLGAVNDSKGIFDLLNVIADNKDAFAGKLELHVGGNGETDRLQRVIAAKGLDGIVFFHGWVSGERKAELLSQCDYYILPSYIEGMPLSILEAMSYGKPVISTYVGGIPEMVDDSVGYLIEPGDAAGLRRVLLSVLGRPDYDAMSQHALRRVEPFLPQQVEHKLAELYASLLG